LIWETLVVDVSNWPEVVTDHASKQLDGELRVETHEYSVNDDEPSQFCNNPASWE
jgi:hypothetical protein